MSNNFSILEHNGKRDDSKDTFQSDDPKNLLKSIIPVNRINLSEFAIPGISGIKPRKLYSDIKFESHVNYNDLCGPWIYPSNPVYSEYIDAPTPNWCVWKFITENDIIYLKKYQQNKQAISAFLENKFVNNDVHTRRAKDVFLKIMWEVFKIIRDRLFNEKSISAVLGVIYLTHTFFISHPRRTTKEVRNFFYETLLLHNVSNPPTSVEVFTLSECEQILQMFHEIYMRNLVLLRIMCYPNYYITINR